jgi:GT2 family glycosyltransferase
MPQLPQISFVIIEYHSVQDVSECAASIFDFCNTVHVEIIVSSNSTYSVDRQAELIDEVSCVTWIFNPKNGGFANGMNAGLKECSGDIVVIMNPDVRIQSGDISAAVEFLSQNKEIGLLGPQIVDSEGAIQDTCRPFMTPLHFLRRIPQRIFMGKDVLLEKTIDYSAIQTVDWVIGAFMMISRDALNTAGCLDEGYFLYVEDMDWCMRIWKSGFKVAYFPDLVVQYKGDRKSTSTITERKFINRYMYYHFKSYMRFLRKFGLNPKR